MAYPVYHNSRNFSIIIHQRISKHQPRSCQNRQGRFSLQLPPMPSTQRVRTAQTGAGTGTRRKGNGLAPLPLPPARAHYPRRKIIREEERKASKIKAFSKNFSDYF